VINNLDPTFFKKPLHWIAFVCFCYPHGIRSPAGGRRCRHKRPEIWWWEYRQIEPAHSSFGFFSPRYGRWTEIKGELLPRRGHRATEPPPAFDLPLDREWFRVNDAPSSFSDRTYSISGGKDQTFNDLIPGEIAWIWVCSDPWLAVASCEMMKLMVVWTIEKHSVNCKISSTA
jgi:hypothetical protein